MNEIRPEHVINGTYGEVWVNGDYMAEAIGLTAEVAIEYEDVNMPRKLAKGRKMVGLEGTGTIKLHKVTSRFITLLSDNLKNGKQTTVTIISKLADPDALGAERIVIKDATLDGMTLANWEAKTKGEEEANFGFSDWDLLDVIEG